MCVHKLSCRWFGRLMSYNHPLLLVMPRINFNISSLLFLLPSLLLSSLVLSSLLLSIRSFNDTTYHHHVTPNSTPHPHTIPAPILPQCPCRSPKGMDRRPILTEREGRKDGDGPSILDPLGMPMTMLMPMPMLCLRLHWSFDLQVFLWIIYLQMLIRIVCFFLSHLIF